MTGLRQSGKTTFLQRDTAFRGRRYLSLDDFATLEAARADPDGLISGREPLTIDEVQRCPDLLVTIKQAVDQDRQPGRFLLSGSANFRLLKGVSETLAGRALYLTLNPFTRREKVEATSTPYLLSLLNQARLPRRRAFQPIADEEILAGSMPPILTGEAKDPGLWFLGYEQTYLERDVRDLSQVADLVSFRALLRLTAARTGQILNQSELARDAKLPVSTVSRHLGILETSFVVSRLMPFLRSRTTRLIKSPKIFISDSGLAAHLTTTKSLGTEADEPMRGALYETYVHQNLCGILGAHLPEADLGFWNVQGRFEVDFVIAHGRRAIAIEVKSASRFQQRNFSGLRGLLAKTPDIQAGILAYNGTEAVSLGERLYAVPLGLLLS